MIISKVLIAIVDRNRRRRAGTTTKAVASALSDASLSVQRVLLVVLELLHRVGRDLPLVVVDEDSVDLLREKFFFKKK